MGGGGVRAGRMGALCAPPDPTRLLASRRLRPLTRPACLIKRHVRTFNFFKGTLPGQNELEASLVFVLFFFWLWRAAEHTARAPRGAPRVAGAR